MDEVRLGAVTLELTKGDIAVQPDIDALVNAANAELRPGGGVAGAIHRAAGPGLARECAPLAPIVAGTCVMTSAHKLPNRTVIHCLGPVYGKDELAAELLASCYRQALLLADQAGLRSIAFPAISTGIFGYPMAEAALIALSTIAGVAPRLTNLRLVRMVLHSDADLEIHRAALRAL